MASATLRCRCACASAARLTISIAFQLHWRAGMWGEDNRVAGFQGQSAFASVTVEVGFVDGTSAQIHFMARPRPSLL